MHNILARKEPAPLILELSGLGNRYGFDEQKTLSKLLATGLIPIQYDPYTRKIDILDTTAAMSMLESSIYSNCLLVREPDAAAVRLAAAPSFSVAGRTI